MAIAPTGIASTVALGTPTITGHIAPSGIANVSALGTPVILSAVGSTLPTYSIFLNGVLANTYIQARSIRRSLTIGSGSRGVCSFTWLNPAATTGSTRPQVDDEVVIYEGSTRFFAGIIEDATERFYNGKPLMYVDVRCTDYGILCDRRIVSKYYTPFMGGTASITIADIVTNFLDGTGISFEPNWDSVILEDQMFNHVTVTEALNQICDKTGEDWRVDFYKVLRKFTKDTGYTSAPCTFTDNDGNFDSLSANRSRLRRRNRQGVKNSRSTVALWEDTITAFAGQTSFQTTYLQEVKPAVYVDGVVKSVVSLAEVGEQASDFYYIPNGIGVFSRTGGLGEGQEVAVVYPGKLPPIYWAEDAADIALHGKLEAVEEVADILDDIGMTEIAAGLLARGKVEPIMAEGVSRKAGWEPGQLLTINTTQPLLSASLLIESVDSEEGEDNTFFRHRIRASNHTLQRTDRADNFFGKLIERTKNPIDRIAFHIGFTLAETIEGITNPGLSTGVKQAVRVADKDGVLRDATLYFKSAADGTPTTDRIVVDVLKNGVSIFPTGDDNKLIFPAGTTSIVRHFTFVSRPLTVAKGDIFTINVIEADATAMDGALELVVMG